MEVEPLKSIYDAIGLRLRRPTDDDRGFVVDLFADETVKAFVAGNSDEIASLLVREICAGTVPEKDKQSWLAESDQTGNPVGFISASGLSSNRVQITFALAAQFRGQRCGQRLVASLLAELASYPRIETVAAVTTYWNSCSQKMLQRCGFIPTCSRLVFEKRLTRLVC